MRLFVLPFFVLSIFATGMSEELAETNETELEGKVQKEDKDKPKEDEPKEKVDVDLIGTAVDEANFYKMRDGTRTTLTQVKGSEALLALQNIKRITPIKQGNKKRLVTSDASSVNKFYCVIGRANNDSITNFDVENLIRVIFFLSGKQYNKEDAKLMTIPVAKTLIDDKLQQQYAELYSLKVKEDTVNSKVSAIAASNSMTVEELLERLKGCGISMEVFKKHIKSRMLLQYIIRFMGDTTSITNQEIAEARMKTEGDLKQKRYHLLEIFFKVDNNENEEEVKERAQSILHLIKNGFNFRVMAEAMSQGTYTGDVGDLGWVRQDCIEKPVLDEVAILEIGNVSGVIKTRTGYKIVYVEDIANPGKVGQSRAEYSVLRSKIQFQGDLFTQRDIAKLNTVVDELKEVTSAAKYKEVCKKHNIKFEERDIVCPDEYEMELINQSSKSKTPVIARSIDDENTVTVIMLVSKKIPDAGLPTDAGLFMVLSSRKIEKEFSRNYKKMKAVAHTRLYPEQLAMVFQ